MDGLFVCLCFELVFVFDIRCSVLLYLILYIIYYILYYTYTIIIYYYILLYIHYYTIIHYYYYIILYITIIHYYYIISYTILFLPFCSLPSSSFFPSLLFSSSLLLFPSPFQSFFPIFLLPSVLHPTSNIHSILVGTWIRLFIFSLILLFLILPSLLSQSNNSTPHKLSEGCLEWCSFICVVFGSGGWF